MKNLALKLARITAELGGIAKDGRNEHQKFDFISYEHLYAAVRPLLSREKVAIIPSVESVKEETYETNSGGTGWRTTVTMKETIIDAESGDTMTASAMGSANDTGDKSLGKAITEADKRWLFKLFKVSSKDDVDPDSETPEPPKSKQKPAAPERKYEPTTTTPPPAPAVPAKQTPPEDNYPEANAAPAATGAKPPYNFAVDAQGNHFCPVHNTRFYLNEKSGKKWYSHKIKDGPDAGKYCNEPQE